MILPCKAVDGCQCNSEATLDDHFCTFCAILQPVERIMGGSRFPQWRVICKCSHRHRPLGVPL